MLNRRRRAASTMKSQAAQRRRTVNLAKTCRTSGARAPQRAHSLNRSRRVHITISCRIARHTSTSTSRRSPLTGVGTLLSGSI